ncbi:twin-arginine translocase TatA/TatE family subunit [Idiomarina loihiensis]|uniref:twin-arginine translocase TatA/TatE family subunit n=1 Tax=Idiomarina TaxID=135575 RepID=UPI000E0E4E1A|nr:MULTISPECIES: twin-arginine translocase TatA/TatE family subunit [unclassified Idiomarina]MCJ8317373.1 twin-arginine translocase TatA/TatE family subunit [Idiomarina sp.]NQZ16987.1 twin-arginine translocase TatA/TatE family subunit [Idiomarina sp.]TDO45963.1 sec-independent protein translocase protein TatA [Idiomarina sp. 017G]|tara:strand:+ start:472 stop:690 length:219 start_codon:yes stop_codon:yes gene_type:complete
MGFGGLSMVQLGILLVIVILLFGSKKLRTLGSDLGSAIKGFKSSVSDEPSGKEQNVQRYQNLTSKEERHNEQ